MVKDIPKEHLQQRTLEQIVVTPCTAQHQVPMVQKVQMTHDAPKLEFIGEVFHIRVVAQRQVSTIANEKRRLLQTEN